jgi:hypothetical protein
VFGDHAVDGVAATPADTDDLQIGVLRRRLIEFEDHALLRVA